MASIKIHSRDSCICLYHGAKPHRRTQYGDVDFTMGPRLLSHCLLNYFLQPGENMAHHNRRSIQDQRPAARRLRLEPLETRQLLAGDLCEFAVEPANPSAIADDQPAQVSSQSFQAADAAGETLGTAADLGTIDETIQRRGRLSFFDRTDIIRFDVPADAEFSASLDRLTRNADLTLLDANGNVISQSTRSGRSSEQVSATLNAGESYFVAITTRSWRTVRYRITLQVETLAPPTETPTETPTESPTETPASQPTNEAPAETAAPAPAAPATDAITTTPVSNPIDPTDIQPLSDVEYYGGSRDWGLNAVAAPESWAAGYEGQGVTVAVIDTGVDLDHPDLVSSLYVNPGEIAGNGIDDDGNGFVDDVSGYDFVSRDGSPDDGNGHGTHVAGTIAAAKNGQGATGVAPEAKILPIRVLDNRGSGSDFNVAAGIRYAADVGAQIINLSLGGGYSSRIANAIQYATSLGSLVVAASGNESASNPSFPARHSAQSTSVISVGAFDSRNRIAGFSNDVGRSGSVQVDAPGVGIFSTYTGGRYGSLSGTSMASPHVAGVAALTLSANPSLTSSELRSLLVSGTDGKATGSDSIGKIDAAYSVAYAAAGLTTAPTVTGGNLASTTSRNSWVRATNDLVMISSTDFIVSKTTSLESDGRFDDSESASPEILVDASGVRIADSSYFATSTQPIEVTDESETKSSDATENEVGDPADKLLVGRDLWA